MAEYEDWAPPAARRREWTGDEQTQRRTHEPENYKDLSQKLAQKLEIYRKKVESHDADQTLIQHLRSRVHLVEAEMLKKDEEITTLKQRLEAANKRMTAPPDAYRPYSVGDNMLLGRDDDTKQRLETENRFLKGRWQQAEERTRVLQLQLDQQAWLPPDTDKEKQRLEAANKQLQARLQQQEELTRTIQQHLEEAQREGDVEVLRAAMNTYKEDFSRERRDRERAQEKIQKLEEEIRRLRFENNSRRQLLRDGVDVPDGPEPQVNNAFKCPSCAKDFTHSKYEEFVDHSSRCTGSPIETD